MTVGLTPRQLETYQAISALMIDLGRAPSVREVGKALGLATHSAAHGLMVQLRERGWVTWTDGRECTLRLTPRAPDAFRLPDAVKARLEAHCAETGDTPESVIADAISLHLDDADRDSTTFVPPDPVPVASA